ncbi:glycerol-3-phosphate responsive antiterminator [Sporolactobacillus sp. THM7-7]|nr:glycerol-3-phosphate responsive antiterminator [Sporolactobacillus sp. THM7-7]
MNQSKTQRVYPAVNNLKDFEKLVESPTRDIIVLDSRLSQVGVMTTMGRRHHKQVFLHADLIQGLKSDLYAAEFICQNLRPYGIISTRANILEVAKKRGIITVQRIFLLDSRSIETGYRLLEQIHPDMVELLPGLIPEMISDVSRKAGIPVIAGGLIRTKKEIADAFAAGAAGVSTSHKDLWSFE